MERVCVSGATGRLMYFVGEGRGGPPASPSDDELWLFGGHSWPQPGSGRKGVFGMRKPEPDASDGLGVTFVSGAASETHAELPDRVVWLRAAPTVRRRRDRGIGLPTTHALFSLFWPSNFGHVIGDDVLPLWAAAAILGVDPSDPGSVEPIAYGDLDAIGSPDKQVDLGRTTYGRARRFVDWAFAASFGACSGFPHVPVLGLDPPFQPSAHSLLNKETSGRPEPDMAKRVGCAAENVVSDCSGVEAGRSSRVGGRSPCSSGVPVSRSAWCFDRLIAGTSGLGMSRPAGRAAWRAMADSMVDALNASSVSPGPTSGVLFLEKTGGRAVVNLRELAAVAQTELGCAAVVVDPSQLGFSAQAKLVRSASVVVTPPGGLSFALTFAHRDTAFVILDAMTPSPSNASAPAPLRLEGWLWDADAGVDATHVALTEADAVPLPRVEDEGLRARLRGYRDSGNLDLFWKYTLVEPDPERVIPAIRGALVRARRRIVSALVKDG